MESSFTGRQEREETLAWVAEAGRAPILCQTSAGNPDSDHVPPPAALIAR